MFEVGAVGRAHVIAKHAVCDQIVAAVGQVVGNAARPLQLHEPSFGPEERHRVLDCLDTGWVSSAGQYVVKFERMVADYVGTKHAIAVVNGTTALHAALLLNGVRPGDEVIVPTLTFVATANAVSHAGATPHFVDVTTDLGVDVAKLADHLTKVSAVRDGVRINRDTGCVIRAMLPVHVFGHPVDLDPLLALAAEMGISVIEDATESVGSRYKGRACGTFGACAVLSFNGNKIITTGGGGMIVTNDDDLAARARHLTTTAKLPHAWAFDHDIVGYNYRMPNINAAIGCGQMEKLAGYVVAKRRLADHYREAFTSVGGARFLAEPHGCESNYWLNTIVLEPGLEQERDAVLEALHAEKIFARPLWTPMHQLPMYRTAPRADVQIADDMFARCINVPSSPSLAAGVAVE